MKATSENLKRYLCTNLDGDLCLIIWMVKDFPFGYSLMWKVCDLKDGECKPCYSRFFTEICSPEPDGLVEKFIEANGLEGRDWFEPDGAVDL